MGRTPIESGEWISPLPSRSYHVTSCVGDPRDKGRRRHAGLDMAARSGTPIKAPAAGRIVFAGNIGGHCGWGIKMMSGDYAILMCHMQRGSPRGKAGASVPKGFQLGLVGNTGTSTGPHLHIEIKRIRPREVRMNPLAQVPAIAPNSLNGAGRCGTGQVRRQVAAVSGTKKGRRR